MEAEDDFWNTSQIKAEALNFDDDDSHQFSRLGAKIRADLSKDTVSSVGDDIKPGKPTDDMIPFDELISELALETILLANSGKFPSKDVKASLDIIETNVTITIKRLVLSRPCSLHHHKSLKSKIQLLDGALAIGDGNVILKVIIFLVQTLKKKLLYQILSSRPIAVNHYVNYLTTRMKSHEVTDLLTMLGRNGDAALKQFQMVVETSNVSADIMLNRLRNLLSNHFSQNTVDAIQLKMLNDYIQLLEWQKSLNVPEVENKSTIQSLVYSCIHHWSDGSGKISSPQMLCQQQQISPQQYDWTALSVQASLKNWPIIETLFVKKNFLGRATFSCCVALPKIIARLSELDAKENILVIYLNQISSLTQKLDLAKKYKVHKIVVDCLVSQKDRQALTQYKMALHPQSDEYFYAENALRASTIKWKN